MAEDFGDSPAPDNVIPFPAMRPNAKLGEVWARAVEAHNQKRKSKHKLVSPADVVGSMLEMRSMPKMPWPADWPQLAARCRTYVGECVGFVGAIGAGKTQKGMQLARGVMGAGMPALWANLELGVEQGVARLLGNMNGEHAMTVLDDWDEAMLRHQVAAVTDMFHFVDRYDDTDEQLQAMRDAIDIAIQVYRAPPLLVVDHIGMLITEAKDLRAEMLRVGKRFEKMALETKSWILILAQGTKSGQELLTGKIEVGAAADAIGAAAESQILQQVCSNVIVSQLYKEDDAEVLEGRDLVAKARWTGREGQIGVKYQKKGGVWIEMDHLPPTPRAVEAAEKAQKADKHRTERPQSKPEIRQALGIESAGAAAALRRAALLRAITERGQFGLEEHALKNVRGVGGGMALHRDLGELERTGAIAKAPGRRWVAVVR
jgi:hypothetical protein